MTQGFIPQRSLELPEYTFTEDSELEALGEEKDLAMIVAGTRVGFNTGYCYGRLYRFVVDVNLEETLPFIIKGRGLNGFWIDDRIGNELEVITVANNPGGFPAASFPDLVTDAGEQPAIPTAGEYIAHAEHARNLVVSTTPSTTCVVIAKKKTDVAIWNAAGTGPDGTALPLHVEITAVDGWRAISGNTTFKQSPALGRYIGTNIIDFDGVPEVTPEFLYIVESETERLTKTVIPENCLVEVLNTGKTLLAGTGAAHTVFSEALLQLPEVIETENVTTDGQAVTLQEEHVAKEFVFEAATVSTKATISLEPMTDTDGAFKLIRIDNKHANEKIISFGNSLYDMNGNELEEIKVPGTTVLNIYVQHFSTIAKAGYYAVNLRNTAATATVTQELITVDDSVTSVDVNDDTTMLELTLHDGYVGTGNFEFTVNNPAAINYTRRLAIKVVNLSSTTRTINFGNLFTFRYGRTTLPNVHIPQTGVNGQTYSFECFTEGQLTLVSSSEGDLTEEFHLCILDRPSTPIAFIPATKRSEIRLESGWDEDGVGGTRLSLRRNLNDVQEEFREVVIQNNTAATALVAGAAADSDLVDYEIGGLEGPIREFNLSAGSRVVHDFANSDISDNLVRTYSFTNTTHPAQLSSEVPGAALALQVITNDGEETEIDGNKIIYPDKAIGLYVSGNSVPTHSVKMLPTSFWQVGKRIAITLRSNDANGPTVFKFVSDNDPISNSRFFDFGGLEPLGDVTVDGNRVLLEFLCTGTNVWTLIQSSIPDVNFKSARKLAFGLNDVAIPEKRIIADTYPEYAITIPDGNIASSLALPDIVSGNCGIDADLRIQVINEDDDPKDIVFPTGIVTSTGIAHPTVTVPANSTWSFHGEFDGTNFVSSAAAAAQMQLLEVENTNPSTVYRVNMGNTYVVDYTKTGTQPDGDEPRIRLNDGQDGDGVIVLVLKSNNKFRRNDGRDIANNTEVVFERTNPDDTNNGAGNDHLIRFDRGPGTIVLTRSGTSWSYSFIPSEGIVNVNAEVYLSDADTTVDRNEINLTGGATTAVVDFRVAKSWRLNIQDATQWDISYPLNGASMETRGLTEGDILKVILATRNNSDSCDYVFSKFFTLDGVTPVGTIATSIMALSNAWREYNADMLELEFKFSNDVWVLESSSPVSPVPKAPRVITLDAVRGSTNISDTEVINNGEDIKVKLTPSADNMSVADYSLAPRLTLANSDVSSGRFTVEVVDGTLLESNDAATRRVLAVVIPTGIGSADFNEYIISENNTRVEFTKYENDTMWSWRTVQL